ncbi:MAG TPA: AIPR family protein [Tardiphaga sp.]
MQTVKVRVADARRIPHPSIAGVEKHYFIVRAADIPSDIPLEANPRDAQGRDLNRRVYKQVKDSLFNRASEVGTFDLMNKGITVIAEHVKKLNDHEYEMTFDEGQGIADGGHTYRLLHEARNDEELPEEQHVEMRVMTGVPSSVIADIAKGLNTGMQVKEFAIENLRGNFEWIKEIVDGQPFEELIAWRENEDKPYDVVDILCLLECFNIFDYPNTGSRHPVAAYEKNSAVMKSFSDDAENAEKTGSPSKYAAFGPILLDVMKLYDIIRHDFRETYNKATKGSAGALKIVDKAPKKKVFSFPFGGLPDNEYRLNPGAALPILAAFRNMVEIDPRTQKARWIGGFNFVLEFWNSVKEEAIMITHQGIGAYGRTPNAIGKARPHWGFMHLTFDRRLAHMLDEKTAPGKKRKSN